jgi:hypothetical protein
MGGSQPSQNGKDTLVGMLSKRIEILTNGARKQDLHIQNSSEKAQLERK